MKTIFKIILFLTVVFWGVKLIVDYYNNGQRQPFWKGTQEVQVCELPYKSSDDCKKRNVTLIDKNTAKVNLGESEYLMINNMTCHLSADVNDGPRYVVCRGWDIVGTQWDLLPSWKNYNNL